jgi:diadenosine tetraphosphate (Ap4A) HIT family hydrolase
MTPGRAAGRALAPRSAASASLAGVSETSLPSFVDWDSFPFEGRLRLKKLEDPVEVEPPRVGEDPADCPKCKAPDDAYIWVNENWRVRSLDRPSGLPMVLILESRSHLDLGDLPNMLAAELGVMTVRLERAIRSLDGVARVHVNRWGDGAAHLHVWFMARPYGRLQLRGPFLTLWDEVLPPIPEEKWRENLAMVAAWLAEFGGEPLAKPPPIAWKAPSSLPADDELAATLAAVGVADADRQQGEPEAAGDREAGSAVNGEGQPDRAGASRGPASDRPNARNGSAGATTGGEQADRERSWTQTADAGPSETARSGSVPA